ncbi:hypothetical protein ASE01_08655 [Nocardioides sp. Root190]|nr:hypothetical protein ASE01_08655 [Nocardioides sp. Root190]
MPEPQTWAGGCTVARGLETAAGGLLDQRWPSAVLPRRCPLRNETTDRPQPRKSPSTTASGLETAAGGLLDHRCAT